MKRKTYMQKIEEATAKIKPSTPINKVIDIAAELHRVKNKSEIQEINGRGEICGACTCGAMQLLVGIENTKAYLKAVFTAMSPGFWEEAALIDISTTLHSSSALVELLKKNAKMLGIRTAKDLRARITKVRQNTGLKS